MILKSILGIIKKYIVP